MEFIHTINSNFERGKKNFIERLGYLSANDVTSFRINMKSFSNEEFIRIEKMFTELKNFSEASSFRYNTYLDIPYPNEKYRGRCGNNIKIKKDDIILLANESSRNDLLKTKYVTIFLDDDFFSTENLKAKHIIYGDGVGILFVKEICNEGIYVKASNDFVLFDKKSFNASHIKKSVINRSVVEKILELCKNYTIDYIMLSFCDKAGEIEDLKKTLCLPNVEFLSKIETSISKEELHKIADVSDGLVVARGDLGLNISHNKFLMYQSLVSQVAKEKNIKLYFATGILDSLLCLPFPSRGDITDLSNIISAKPYGLIFDSKMGFKKRVEVLNEYIRFQKIF